MAIAAVAALIVALWILGIISLVASSEFEENVASRGNSSLRSSAPSSPKSDGELGNIAPGGGRPPPDPPALSPSLISRSKSVVVTSDVRGNLGPSSVLNQDPPGEDWLKDRWQAASDMGGTAIKGAHWVMMDFGSDISARIGSISKVVLDWETAYADDYRVEVGFDTDGGGVEGGDGDVSGSEGGDDARRRWTVLHDGADAEHRRTMRRSAESGQSPGVKKKMPLHIVHTLGPFPNANWVSGRGVRYLRVWIRKPASGWGVSLWQVDVYGTFI